MNQFLCGCPIWFGVAIIIAVNLVHNLFSIVTVTMNIIFKIPTFGASDPPSAQIFNAAWCLLGLPFIFSAMWGMWSKQESNMRLYLVYLFTTFALDLGFVVQALATGDLCGHMPPSLKHHGAAFACGFLRIAGVGLTLMMITVIGYSVYTVWSYCEDLKAGGGGKGLDQLMVHQDEAKNRDAYGAFANAVGKVGEVVAADHYSKARDFGGSSRIFNGKYHETNYPPPVRG